MDETPQATKFEATMSGNVYELKPDGHHIVQPGAFPEHATVPLVVYVDGERQVIGEAIIEGDVVRSRLGNDIGNEVLEELFGKPENMHFSLGSNEVVVADEPLPKCICPWNNNYIINKKPSHNAHCPTLRGKHGPHDGCGPLGHRDGDQK